MNLAQAVIMNGLQRPERVDKAEPVSLQRLTRFEMAERVFDVAARAGNPYEHITPRQWAKKWLASPEFVLAEVETDKVALLRTPRNQERVLRNMQAQKESLEPVVVDLNYRELKEPKTGYVPAVIAVDGAHRAYGQYLQGRDSVLAWVGTKALARVKMQPLILASAYTQPPATNQTTNKVISAALLHAAQGIPQPARQDTGDGGPAPTGQPSTAMKSGAPGGSKYIRDRGVKAGGPGSGPRPGQGGTGPKEYQTGVYDHFKYNPKTGWKCKHCGTNGVDTTKQMSQHLKEQHGRDVQSVGGGTGSGAGAGTGGPGGATSGANPNFIHSKKMKAARRTPEARSSGQLQQPDPSDMKTPPDPSDAGQGTDASDQLQYETQPQLKPPGVRKAGSEERGFQNPVSDAPGAGVGPRLNPSNGASNSERQRKMAAKGKCSDCGDDMEAGPIKVKKLVTKKKKKRL